MRAAPQNAVALKTAAGISAALPHLIRLPTGRVWIGYDAEADVLYVSLKRPQKATDTIDEAGILYRYRGRELVGLTILGASKRHASNAVEPRRARRRRSPS